MISFLSPIKDIYGYKAAYLGGIQIWPSAKISVFPKIVNIREDGESIDIEVAITGTEDKSYSIIGIPSWLTVSNKTETGFTLTANANTSPFDEPIRTADITVKLDNYPSYATLTVNQPRIIPILEVDIDTTLQPVSSYATPLTISLLLPVNSSINWGDGSPVLPPLTVATRLYHTYAADGKYTIKINEITDIPNNLYQANVQFPAIATNFRMNNGGLTIGNNAFSAQTNLGEVKFSENLISIGTTAFYKATKLASDIVFKAINSLSGSIFEGTSIRTVIFEDTCPITTINLQMFKTCTSLTKCRLSSSITTIGDNVFNGCSNLVDFSCPKTITSIGTGAFYGTIHMAVDLEFDTLDNLGGASFNNSGIRTFKVSKLSRTGTSVSLVGNFANLTTLHNNIYFGDENSGNNIDINSMPSSFTTNANTTDNLWYYGNILPHVSGSFSGMSANFKIHMKQAVINQYDSTNFPEWNPLMSKVVPI